MKLAILGGSFNPPHIGHLALASAVIPLGYERVIFVPAFESPFKQGAVGANPRDRLDMLAASIPTDTRLTVDDSEIRREGVSYTADTLNDIARRYYPDGKLGLIIGEDLAQDLPKWHKYEEIRQKAEIIIARRFIPSLDENIKLEKYEENNGTKDKISYSSATKFNVDKFQYPHRILENAVIPISSAMIREKIAKNEPWKYLVPQGARVIIEERGLYFQFPPPGSQLPSSLIYRMEDATRFLVSPSRFLHSRNVALLAADLCIRFGLDSRRGYLAGIVHDICKSFSTEELTDIIKRNGGKISKMGKKKPALLHAPAGALFIREKFDIQDEDILESVRVHTIGAKHMGQLAKIVFIADKIEVTRPSVRPVIREMCQHVPLDMSLDELFSLILNETVDFMRSRNMDISQETLRLLDAMQRKTDSN
ncbi:MAG: nicotinate (nicotinamide) nucleotide adenylyltransferase [Treponema sp.]|jgi:nicotinate-nucleotide adenylyltransferase|nr:nicotinate (nicotinamide) nucleotide adenylyltransferase [Treponema sp.]